MPKSRKTRKEKIKTSQKKNTGGFQIKEEWLKGNHKKSYGSDISLFSGTKYLRQDLTKTFVLTMLVLALELALWLYLSRH